MRFKKVTISLPERLYDEGNKMVEKGLFSNFSDLVRSGIREEFKEMAKISSEFDRKHIYSDKRLVSDVKRSVAEAESGKGKIAESEKEIDEYMDNI